MSFGKVLACMCAAILNALLENKEENFVSLLFEGLKTTIFLFEKDLTLSQASPGFSVSAVQVFENTVGKEEIARNEQFLLFPQCFPST